MTFQNILLRLGGSGVAQPRGPGWDTGWRSLPVCLLEIPEGGQWVVETGLRSWIVAAGQCIFVPAGLRHRMRSICEKCMRSTWCMVDWERSGELLRFQPEPLLMRGAEVRRAVMNLAKARHNEEMSLAHALEIQAAALRLLAEGLAERVIDTQMDPRILKALTQLRANVAAAHSVEGLAKSAGLSTSRFHELFLAHVGESPVRHLKSLRVRQAMEWLSHTRLPQIEIAERCGFQSLAYFSRCFRAATGMAPGQFRRGHKSGM